MLIPIIRLVTILLSLLATYLIIQRNTRQRNAKTSRESDIRNKVEAARPTIDTIEGNSHSSKDASADHILALLYSVSIALVLSFVSPHLTENLILWLAAIMAVITLAGAIFLKNNPWSKFGVATVFILLVFDGLSLFKVWPLTSSQPVPTSTSSPPATFSASPTALPLRPIAELPGAIHACLPPAPLLIPLTPSRDGSLPMAIRLTGDGGIPRKPAGKDIVAFFDGNEIPIAHQFDGSEMVCISSTSSGRGLFSVDDLLLLLIINEDPTKRPFWVHDFSDPNAFGLGVSGVTPYEPQDITSLFPSGKNKARIILINLFPDALSSTEIWITIWKKP